MENIEDLSTGNLDGWIPSWAAWPNPEHLVLLLCLYQHPEGTCDPRFSWLLGGYDPERKYGWWKRERGFAWNLKDYDGQVVAWRELPASPPDVRYDEMEPEPEPARWLPTDVPPVPDQLVLLLSYFEHPEDTCDPFHSKLIGYWCSKLRRWMKFERTVGADLEDYDGRAVGWLKLPHKPASLGEWEEWLRRKENEKGLKGT